MSDATAPIRSPVARVPGGRAKRPGRAGTASPASSSRRPSWRCSCCVFIAPLALRAVPEPVPRAARRRQRASSGSTTTSTGLKDQQFIDGVNAGRAVHARPGADHADPGARLRADHRLGQGLAAKLFRVGIFVPYAVPAVIAALMWGYLYGKDFGPFADLADTLGGTPPNFLSEQTMLFSIANVVDVDVHRLQHDHPLRRAAGDPGRALRGGGGRRRGRRSARRCTSSCRCCARRSCCARSSR